MLLLISAGLHGNLLLPVLLPGVHPPGIRPPGVHLPGPHPETGLQGLRLPDALHRPQAALQGHGLLPRGQGRHRCAGKPRSAKNV